MNKWGFRQRQQQKKYIAHKKRLKFQHYCLKCHCVWIPIKKGQVWGVFDSALLAMPQQNWVLSVMNKTAKLNPLPIPERGSNLFSYKRVGPLLHTKSVCNITSISAEKTWNSRTITVIDPGFVFSIGPKNYVNGPTFLQFICGLDDAECNLPTTHGWSSIVLHWKNHQSIWPFPGNEQHSPQVSL